MVGVITIHAGRSYCLEDMNTLNIVVDVIALADVIAMCMCCFFIYMFDNWRKLVSSNKN